MTGGKPDCPAAVSKSQAWRGKPPCQSTNHYKHFGPLETRDDSYTDVLLASLVSRAQGKSLSIPTATAALLSGMDLTAEEVIDRGGINAAARGVKPKSASEADLPGNLAEAEAEIADTKQAYYDALSRRNRALRALAREGGDE